MTTVHSFLILSLDIYAMASLPANIMFYLSLYITGARLRALKLKASCEEQITEK